MFFCVAILDAGGVSSQHDNEFCLAHLLELVVVVFQNFPFDHVAITIGKDGTTGFTKRKNMRDAVEMVSIWSGNMCKKVSKEHLQFCQQQPADFFVDMKAGSHAMAMEALKLPFCGRGHDALLRALQTPAQTPTVAAAAAKAPPPPPGPPPAGLEQPPPPPPPGPPPPRPQVPVQNAWRIPTTPEMPAAPLTRRLLLQPCLHNFNNATIQIVADNHVHDRSPLVVCLGGAGGHRGEARPFGKLPLPCWWVFCEFPGKAKARSDS